MQVRKRENEKLLLSKTGFLHLAFPKEFQRGTENRFYFPFFSGKDAYCSKIKAKIKEKCA